MFSKFFKVTKINDDIYALYNSFLMEPIFVNEDEYHNIINCNFDKNTKIILKNKGIIADEEQDNEALELVKSRYFTLRERISVMYLLISNICNLNCRYCFINKNKGTEMNNCNIMTKETAITALNKFYQYCKLNNIKKPIVIFYGGEPLLNLDVLLYVLTYAKRNRYDFRFSLITNGLLLTKENIDLLSKYNISYGLSIDGPKFINDKNRVDFKEKGTYDDIFLSIKLLKERKIPFGLSITISNDTLKYKEEVYDWILSLDVKDINFNLLHFYKNNNGEVLQYYKEATRFLEDFYNQFSKYGFSDGRINRKINSFVNNQFRYADCAAVSASQITVKTNGDVCICHGYAKNNKNNIGNILTDSIEEMWKNPIVDEWFLSTPIFKKECEHCEAISICGFGCKLQGDTLYGKNKLDEPFCVHTKESLNWLLKKLYYIK